MNILSKALLAATFAIVTGTTAQAQIIVNVRPARPRAVVVRPAAPSPRHVWVDEEWAPAGNSYQWRGGYWVEPPRPRATWVPGHWSGRKRGYSWIPGHWR